ncbi:MAG: phosphomannomutase/phosphoglucomutase [Candidatus Ratteibacteria bacterium]|nr:phosphomannomutase/phosphoglucomutase [Candidatus Ratteibacteria bacterium]
MEPHIFREYDIRGLVEKDLTEEVARQIGQAIGTYLKKSGNKIVVGKDNRKSSPSLANALIEGLLSAGCDVIDIGTLPTPVLYFSIQLYSQTGGVMITGSHNPPEYNGIKICKGLSSIYGKEIQNLRGIIESKKFEKGKGSLTKKDPKNDYIDFIAKRVKVNPDLKIIIDAGNGTSGFLVPELMEKLNIKPSYLYIEPDGNFPNHLPDPTVYKNMQDLIDKVRQSNADVGIGYDGDADRIGAIDDKGRIVWGDKLLCLYAKEVLSQHPHAKVIMDVKCSQATVEYIEKYGGKAIMWKTGHSLIKEKMKEEGALLAGEMSGHMFFKDNYLGFDDAFFASLRLLEILSKTKEKLSQLVDKIPNYYSTPEIRIDCPEQEKFKVVEQLKKYFQKKYKTIDIDGVRILFKNGWGLIRASNTQPILVLRFEAQTERSLQDIKNEIKKKLEEYPFITAEI